MTAQRFSVDPSEFATKRVLVTGGTKGMVNSAPTLLSRVE